MSRRAQDALPTAEFQILLALLEGPAHGHGIRKDVAARTDGEVEMGPGTLYTAIKRMLERGLIRETDERPAPSEDDPRRRYYRITGPGEEAARAEARRMARLLDVAADRSLIPDWRGA